MSVILFHDLATLRFISYLIIKYGRNHREIDVNGRFTNIVLHCGQYDRDLEYSFELAINQAHPHLFYLHFPECDLIRLCQTEFDPHLTQRCLMLKWHCGMRLLFGWLHFILIMA
ncbi:MAG: hypothetical protein GY805_31505 [Chloroflexi bacterium]|nr:hypothetical protein [Chloroflexota bacterium]